jgi:peptide/nickel transport system substrate-binding protein
METRTYILISVMVIMVMVAAYSINVVYAQQKPQIIQAIPSTLIYVPSGPNFNPYAPSNIVGSVATWVPLAFYNPFTGQFYPVLAKNWTIQILPNGSALFTIYLRKGLYWFNGSAVIPFTAWDVYAYFYIGMKAFWWYSPWINNSLTDEDIRVLNNYTIQFLFQKWTTFIPYWMLPSWISTPYPVWKPIIDKLRTMNLTQAVKYSTNITEFVPSYWALSPYYLTYLSSTYIDITLEPMYYNGVPLLARWEEIFPFANWNDYNPTIVNWYVAGNTQAMSAFLAGKATWGGIGLSEQQVGVLNKSGVGVYLWFDYSAWGITITPYTFPFNIPEVRQALCDVINRSEVVAAWGLNYPMYAPEPAPPYTWSTYPPSVRQFLIPCEYNPSYAAQVLQKYGLYKKGGQWYLPNGTQLTITILGPSGWTDWMTMTSDAAEQLSAFGIKTQLIGQDVGIYWGTTFPKAQFEAAIAWLTFAKAYSSAWSFLSWPFWSFPEFNVSVPWTFQWPNGTCSPVYMPVIHTPYGPMTTPNGTIVWCINSTLGYINFTNWVWAFDLSYPGTPDYDELLDVIFSWYHYWVPVIPLAAKIEPFEYLKSFIDPLWVYQSYIVDNYPWFTAFTVPYYSAWGASTAFAYVYAWLGAVAPPGIVPPVAEAIANGSIWTKYEWYAKYLGIPTPDPKLQEVVASYFHIPYTPVTTTTTTSTTTTTTPVTTTTTSTTTTTTTTTAVSTVTTTATVTSTVTSTVASTTTAVTTVTVTKPVISTALVAGIVAIVVVVAAVAALIAMRRR